MDAELAKAIGRMESTLKHVKDGQDQLIKKVDAHNTRLHKVENTSRMSGAITGSVAGIGVSLLVAMLKEKLGMN